MPGFDRDIVTPTAAPDVPYGKQHHREYYTLAEGCPYANVTASLQLRGSNGGALPLLADTQLIERLAHFSRERIPERVVHAKAAGAFGTFEVTHDCTDFTCASFLNTVGKKTDVLLRVSEVAGESGSSDSARDVRGWAMKFYTDEGNLDWVFNDTPIFFVRDPVKFPDMNRSHKRHPATHRPDPNMFWDYHAGNQEGFHQLMQLFSDRGTPGSIRRMNGYSGHTYKFIKEDGSFYYTKIHIKSDAGFEGISQAEATRRQTTDPDHLLTDLWNAIERGDYPTYTVYAQLMTPEQAEKYRWNIFDLTKVWPHRDFPLRPIGKFTLNRNPRNYFAEIEQAAFSPSTMVPGWGPSADPMLQARMFAYPDAARYRLGVNYQQLPTNRSRAPVFNPVERDGHMNLSDNCGDTLPYVGGFLPPAVVSAQGAGRQPPASAADSRPVQPKQAAPAQTNTLHDQWVGQVVAFSSTVTDEDWVQPWALWQTIKKEGGAENFCNNVASTLAPVVDDRLREEVVRCFSRVDPECGHGVHLATEKLRKEMGL